VFLVLSLLAALFGFTGQTAQAAFGEVARIFFGLFLMLFMAGACWHKASGRGRTTL
jgi:uncharacterized membrane protein YtjA (UPF0391 family)